ncbi:YciI family protein [Streptomyces mutabilis]|uniref:YciI family protein n=1 Tax=Streptomyces mutabilis TaxID=67332 RepID=UPI0008FAFC59
MFVLELSYTAPPESRRRRVAGPRGPARRAVRAGVFLASGRKEPRDGGVIIAVAEDRARIEAIAAGDPFVRAGVCAYRVTEFVATKTAPTLAPYRETRLGAMRLTCRARAGARPCSCSNGR